MGDITITAADVRPLPGALCRRFDAGGTVYAGEAVYMASDGDVERTDADDSLTAQAIGIVVADNDGGTVFSSGDAVDVCMFGPLTGYSSLTEGLHVFVSGTAGGMQQDDIGGGTYEFIVGRAESETTIFVNPYAADLTVKS
jgi:hypothetical protein